ncbi:MAG: hypothetical protein ACRD6N_00730 [Pyrinomonadaceae bacterium]
MRYSAGPIGLLALVAIAGLAVLLFHYPAAAQCAMCRASLAGSNNASFIRNFNIGVLVLLVPPVAMFCSFFIILRRHKMRDDEEQGSEKKDPPRL